MGRSLRRPDGVVHGANSKRDLAFALGLEARHREPRILIAGCGTGKHALSYAPHLSELKGHRDGPEQPSPAYATRKARELGVGNVEFIQGDILNVDASEQTFDVISCAGVLHYMAEPERGLEGLLRVLNAEGYLMLALYSEHARQDIARAKSLIDASGFEPSLVGIRACREFIKRYPGNEFRSLTIEAIDLFHLNGAGSAVPC
jgi:ubiquinone/menaquinone biosynthesis C-methylase UbiE